jgi:hypothetical protein
VIIKPTVLIAVFDIAVTTGREVGFVEQCGISARHSDGL